MDVVNSNYSGESVRHAIRRLYGDQPNAPVMLPHATVPPITKELVQEHTCVLDAIVNTVHEQLCSEEEEESATAAATSPLVAGHWLLSVPSTLQGSEENVVNYLGMLVAVDFCHWAEVLPTRAHADEMRHADPTGMQGSLEEGGITTAPGETVTGFTGFYAVVKDNPTDSSSTSTSGVNGAASTTPGTLSADVARNFAEPSGMAVGPSVSGEGAAFATAGAGEVKRFRGSAAMMVLLCRAVEVHHIPWYDISYLRQFCGDVDAALSAMRVCFVGCEEDGITQMWMPCTRTRIKLLLSLADTFAKQGTSFYALLRQCAGYIFRPPAGTAAACAGVCGFVPSLVRLHPRYGDFSRECGDDIASARPAGEPQPPLVPILKLSQLTALALEQALPALWRNRRYAEDCASVTTAEQASAESSPLSWLSERAASPHSTGLFTDRAELSICCDYQIPKTLRAAGLLIYDEALAHAVDHHVLLRPGSAEEASIRIATLVAADRLLEYLNTEGKLLLQKPRGAERVEVGRAPCTVNHLDYALWYTGRYMVPSEARHHLCRTIMY
jgi:hypothetical protein